MGWSKQWACSKLCCLDEKTDDSTTICRFAAACRDGYDARRGAGGPGRATRWNYGATLRLFRGVTAELTATCRVGLHRYTFPAAKEAHLLFDPGAPIGMTGIEHASAVRGSPTEITGEVVMSPTHRRKVPCTAYFVAQVDRPMAGFAGWRPTGSVGRGLAELPDGKISGIQTGAYLTYTDLFRMGFGKRIYNDIDGQYTDRAGAAPVVRRLPLRADGKPSFNLLDMDCLWGSQWNLNLLWSLASRDVAESFLEYARHNGVLPRGVWGGRDSYVMTGDPTTPFLAALACQGLADFDLKQAYSAARKNAFPGGVRDRSGYVPVEVQQRTSGWHSGGTALTLEYAYQDWCLAHLARLAGDAS